MSLLQEALTISLTGIAAVFLSLTLLVFVLFVLSKLLKPKIDPEIPEKEITNSKETISTSNHSDSVNPVAENSDKPPENHVLTPEDKELEEVAIIAAIAASIGASPVQPETSIAAFVRPPQGIGSWRRLGRQQFIQSQGVTPGTWKR